nr:BAG family molecular chaperone regulator 1-like [Setaria viridis]
MEVEFVELEAEAEEEEPAVLEPEAGSGRMPTSSLLSCHDAGELKKLVAAKTGLHPDDQKVLYKDKDRDSKAFLDMASVKDQSKLVIVEDPEAKVRRLIERRHVEKAAKAVAAVTTEVDKLAPMVR